MQNSFFSIIIPVYNADRFIDICLESIVNQSFEDYEVILIDDGSTDKSVKLIEKYLDDVRFKLYQQTNLGAPTARNKGIEYATGKYLFFIDNDDWIETNTLATLHRHLKEKEVDILSFGLSTDFIDENYNIIKKSGYRVSTDFEGNRESIIHLFLDDVFHPQWNKVYLRSFVQKYELRLGKEYHSFADYQFNCVAYLVAGSLMNIPDVLYHYIKRNIETGVTKFIVNNDQMLLEKRMYYKNLVEKYDLLQDARFKLFDIQLRNLENEDYIINLFKNTSTVKGKERRYRIKKQILNKTELQIIRQFKPLNLINQIYKYLCLTKSATLISIVYKILVCLKDRLNGIYRWFRKYIN